MLGVDVGGTDEPVDGEVDDVTVVGVEMKDPSGLVFGDVGFKVAVVETMTGAERLFDETMVVDAPLATADVLGVSEATDVFGAELSGVVVANEVMEGSGASTLRLRSSEDPPQAAATRRSAASRKDGRCDFTSETLFRFVSDGSSADEIGVANNGETQEQGLQEQFFVHVQAETTHRRVNVVDGRRELADAVRIVCVRHHIAIDPGHDGKSRAQFVGDMFATTTSL